MSLMFEVSRLFLLAVTLIGSMYSARNYRSAARDTSALRLSTHATPLLITVSVGMRDDQLRLLLAQSILLLASAVALLGPVPQADRSWPVLGVFVCLLCASLVLAYMSYQQLQRRIRAGRLIARQRDV